MIFLCNLLLDGKPSDITIDGALISRITEHGAETAPEGAETVDCTGKAAIPGFINMHTHAAMGLLRGITEDVPLRNWLSRIWEMEARIDEEFIYWGTRAACLEMIKSGTTTFNDMYWFASNARQAAIESGIDVIDTATSCFLTWLPIR